MADAGDLIDRVFRNYLEPPDEQPSWAPIETAGGINATATTVTYRDGFLSVPEENALGPGSIFEINRELFAMSAAVSARAITFSPVANYRGLFNTTAAVHAIDDRIKFLTSTSFSRQGVFDAVADAVEDLWDGNLWGTGTHLCDTSAMIYGLPSTIVEVELFRYEDTRGKWLDATGRVELLTDHQLGPDNLALQTWDLPTGRVAELVYRYRIARPTDETTAITGLATDWEELVVLGAAARAITATPTISASVQSFATQSLQAQGFQPGESESLVGAMIRFYRYREGRAAQGLARRRVANQRVVNSGLY